MMYARQEFGRRLFPSGEDGNLMRIAFLFQTRVAFPASVAGKGIGGKPLRSKNVLRILLAFEDNLP